MTTLNPNHPHQDTPPQVRDWLDLIYQSIHSPERPIINLQNAGIKRAADLIDYEKLTPKELAEAKNKEQGEVVRSIYILAGEKKKSIEVAQKLIIKGLDNESISEVTGLSQEEIAELRIDE